MRHFEYSNALHSGRATVKDRLTVHVRTAIFWAALIALALYGGRVEREALEDQAEQRREYRDARGRIETTDD